MVRNRRVPSDSMSKTEEGKKTIEEAKKVLAKMK